MLNICHKFHLKNLPTIFFFTDRKKIDDFTKIIKNLPQNSAIIIREYDLNKESREIFAKKIINLAKNKKIKILIGKDINLARKVKANGVHFSDYDIISLKFLKKTSFAKDFIFSFACHKLSNIIKYKNYDFDVVFLSPIFATTSHPGSKPLGISNLAKARKINPEIFALGGINDNNIQSLTKLKIKGFGAIDFFK